jgi:integrase
MKTYLEPREVEQIEQAAECLRDKLLVRLLARLGCRVSEALGLSVSDIDFGVFPGFHESSWHLYYTGRLYVMV